MNKKNVSQQHQGKKLTAERVKTHSLQNRLDQLIANHNMTLVDKATLQVEVKTALTEIERLNNALIFATEKTESLTVTNTELS